jgi:hypothetical protein
MTRACRAVHVQFVLTATVIYHDMALDLPPWADKTIDKIHQSYMWHRKRILFDCLAKSDVPKRDGWARNLGS